MSVCGRTDRKEPQSGSIVSGVWKRQPESSEPDLGPACIKFDLTCWERVSVEGGIGGVNFVLGYWCLRTAPLWRKGGKKKRNKKKKKLGWFDYYAPKQAGFP